MYINAINISPEDDGKSNVKDSKSDVNTAKVLSALSKNDIKTVGNGYQKGRK